MGARLWALIMAFGVLALCSACGGSGSSTSAKTASPTFSATAKPITAGTTDPLTVLTAADQPAPFVPMEIDNDPNNIAKYGASCCASPGNRACQSQSGSSPTAALPPCFNFDATIAKDPYGTQYLCTLPDAAPDPAIAQIGQDGGDTTFYVTSDLHFYRRTFELTDQLKHVQVVKGFAGTRPAWPTGSGALTGSPIGTPLAVVIDGDMTTYGTPTNLGAFRLLWERGTIPDSIQYPILVGLGNHEVVSDETALNAQRMFAYVQARMANTHIDPGSGNYSWDWNGVHMIQLNTWAGDKTSLYVHPSDGLAWLANDLKTYVGNTTKPVMLFQHYLFTAVNTKSSLSTSDDDYWPTDQNAIDSTGQKTGQGYQTWYNIVKNYNVIALFGGHDHCLGVTSSILSKLPVTGGTYPAVQGYGLPIDNFDDGSGGDTRGTVAQDPKQESAGIGNPCSPTVVGAQTIPQTAVASFLVTNVSSKYLTVAAVSWNDKTAGTYFDNAEGMPTGLSACRKRINSQFIPAPAVQVRANGSGYTVTSTGGTPANVPVALQFGSQSGASGFAFVDNCGDPQNTGSNHVYYLVNGESSLTPGASYAVQPSFASGAQPGTPTVIALTPLSGVSTPSFARPYAEVMTQAKVNPIFDTFTVYGPPGQGFQQSVAYTGPASGWLTVTPRGTTFDAYGTAVFVVHYNLGALTNPIGVLKSSAQVQVVTGGTNVTQNVKVSLTS